MDRSLNNEEIIGVYYHHIANWSHEDDLGQFFGRPESSLPLKKEVIKAAIEAKLFEYSLEYLETGNRVAERLRDELELRYSYLGEYLPDDKITLKVTGPGRSLADRINEAKAADKDEGSRAVSENKREYEIKAREIRLWADYARVK